MLRALLLLALGLSGAPAPLPQDTPAILTLRERSALRDRWLAERLETVLPGLMRATGIDLWVLAAREYNEDPVLATMLPATWMSARRRTILVLHDPGEGRPLERLAVARYGVGAGFERAWDPAQQPDQWARLAELVAAREPARIGLNVSGSWALADGLTAAEREALLAALPGELRGRVVSAQDLAVRWLETRSSGELEAYPGICRIAHGILAEGLSEAAIEPGVTTTEDLSWWYRERIAALGLGTWFQPDVSVQRASGGDHAGEFSRREGPRVIRPGDLVHVDLGIVYLGLATDMQQHAYVLREGEREAPAGLRRGLATANRLQDLLMAQFAAGRSGNEVLRRALAAARAEGIEASIYSHPLGFHGHAAGAAIGMWDRQDGVPVSGEWPLHPATCWSIELNAAVAVPEWGGQSVRFMLEEDALFDGERCRFLDGRQTELWLVPRPSGGRPESAR
jgi:Xaa-Pro aminopeptidase